MIYYFVHIMLALYYGISLVWPPVGTSSGAMIHAAIYLCVVILSFCKVALARKVFLLMAYHGVGEVHQLFSNENFGLGFIDLAFWCLVVYFALYRRWNYLYSKWGWFEKFKK